MALTHARNGPSMWKMLNVGRSMPRVTSPPRNRSLRRAGILVVEEHLTATPTRSRRSRTSRPLRRRSGRKWSYRDSSGQSRGGYRFCSHLRANPSTFGRGRRRSTAPARCAADTSGAWKTVSGSPSESTHESGEYCNSQSSSLVISAVPTVIIRLLAGETDSKAKLQTL